MARTFEPIARTHLSTRLWKLPLRGGVIMSLIAAAVTELSDPNMSRRGRRGAVAGRSPA